jgi:hypothetical protein
MIKLSYSEAMQIQTRQLVWYRQAIGRKGIKAIRQATSACPDNIHPDKPISIFEINMLVPRGACFERHIFYWPSTQDPTRMDWYKAHENNKLYSC